MADKKTPIVGGESQGISTGLVEAFVSKRHNQPIRKDVLDDFSRWRSMRVVDSRGWGVML